MPEPPQLALSDEGSAPELPLDVHDTLHRKLLLAVCVCELILSVRAHECGSNRKLLPSDWAPSFGRVHCQCYTKLPVQELMLTQADANQFI